MAKLTSKQKVFINEYCSNGFNATKAAINDMDNLQVLCRTCNGRKGNLSSFNHNIGWNYG